MSSAVTSTNGVVVITHVHPAGNGIGAASPPHFLGQAVSSMLENFRKGDPKALGTVQIMIGLMLALIGIVATVGWFSLGVYSGIFVWGTAFYIIAGSLTVAADNKLNTCLVKGSLGMNIVAAITASTGTILYSLDAAGVLFFQNCYDHQYGDWCGQYLQSSMGISGVMAVFSFLELIVSIYVSSFACKAVCSSMPEQVFIIGNQTPQGSTMTQNVTPYPLQYNYETVRYPKGPEEGSTAVHQNNQPPQYTAAIP